METEFKSLKANGFLMIFNIIIALIIAAYLIIVMPKLIILSIILILFAFLGMSGFIMIEPNDMKIIMLFGKYKGTIKDNGFFWINPFYTKIKLTSRARNLDVEPIKVNDKAGNPVMIGLVLVWKIRDSYKALFDIDSSETNSIESINIGGLSLSSRMATFQRFVSIQSDSALRNIASEYSYDNNESGEEVTLRSGGDAITKRLEQELNNRLSIAGIEVMEARINYLAYAPEIASVMLRRQQADAIISAREKIVEGAVSMVKLAIDKLENENIVEMDKDKKANLVSNLLVVLCSDEQTQPIVNTSSR
ncbi:MAG: SPFH domain-containing protein [Bacteroidetes bacterium]|nr:SPFH domain-containing protein [Bacteroidota bacterium]